MIETGGEGTKADVIKDAYSQMRISGLTVTPTPEDLELALQRLENMASEWRSRNIIVNYRFEDYPDPNTDLGVPRAFWHAFSTNLALRLLPDFGKDAMPVLTAQATQSLSSLSAYVARNRMTEVPYPRRQPIGSGQRWWRWWRFYYGENNDFAAIMLTEGDIEDYTEHFDTWLDLEANEEIDSFSVTVTPRLALESSAATTSDVMYRLRALDASDSEQVTIIVTSTTGRVTTRKRRVTIKAKAHA